MLPRIFKTKLQEAVSPGPAMRPTLSLPGAEAARLRAAYEGARVILEYGSGGSTLMAAEMPGKTITAVESDEAWADRMRAWFADNPPAQGTAVDIRWVDIGPTGEWGHPCGETAWRNFAAYPLGVWSTGEALNPDVVLVDGRFRAGCAMATALNITAPVDLFIDDYAGRRRYHAIEHWLGAPELTGRMAYFRVTPLQLDPRDLLQVIAMMTDTPIRTREREEEKC